MLLALLLQAAAPPPGAPPRPDNAPAPATVMAEPVALLFAAADRDGDGRTSRVELAQAVEASFARVSRGAAEIGYLAFADWAERELGSRTALPSPFEVDRDGNNRITLIELQTRIATLADRFDADKDGTISRAELLTIRGGADRPGGPPPGGRRGGERQRPPGN